MYNLNDKKLIVEWDKIKDGGIFDSIEEFAQHYHSHGEKQCFRKYTAYQKMDKAKGSKLICVMGIVLGIILIIGVFAYVGGRKQTVFPQLFPENGVLDVTDVDFSDKIYTVDNLWPLYHEKLYTSADFASGNVVEPIVGVGEFLKDNKLTYGTYRLIIKGKPNQYLAICGYSVDYATRVFVDGIEVVNIGNVTDNEETHIPKTGYMTIPIHIGESGEVEVIYQFCNFVHKDAGTIHYTFCSTMENIEQYKRDNNLAPLVFGGALLAFALYFLLHALIQKRVEYAFFAICSMLAAFRNQIFFIENLLPPNTSFYINYPLGTLVVSLLPAAFLFLLTSLYPPKKKSEGIITAVYAIAVAVMAILHFTVSTNNVVTVCVVTYGLSLPYLIYMLYRIVRHYLKLKKLELTDYLTIGGYTVLFIAVLAEAIFGNEVAFVTRGNLFPIGALIFVLFISSAIGLRIKKDETNLIESRNKSKMLEQMNETNKEFLKNVAHELKTPLAVMSGYAQLTNMQIERHSTDEETLDNLKTIQSEAQRLGNIVTSLADYTDGKTTEVIFENVNVKTIFNSVSAICKPICEKRRNALSSNCNEKLNVTASRDTLVQILVNLVVNANKHTENGTIEISAQQYADNRVAVFSVSDSGNGISTEVAEHIFERGYSADGGSGLGLAVCKAAVEMHGGAIKLEKSDDKGTTFAFTIPMVVEI